MISHFLVIPPQTPFPLPPFPPSPLPLWGCSPIHPPSPAPPLQHPPMLAHETSTESRASPSIDVSQGYPLLPMYLEPWIPPYTLLHWLSSPWEYRMAWLSDVVLPMRLQSPSAPLVLPPTPPQGSWAQSYLWLQASISTLVNCWPNLPRNSHTRFLSASASWQQQQCWGLMSTDGRDP